MSRDLIPELQKWATSIARSIARRLPPSIEADDLVQVAMLATCQAQDSFDLQRGVPFTAYAYPRVRGAVLMSIRGRTWREATHEEMPEVETAGWIPAFDDEIGGAELVAIVERCLGELPQRTAQAARWVWLYGQNTLDVARAMGVSRSTVYAMLKDARTLLSREFDLMRTPVLFVKSNVHLNGKDFEPGRCIPVTDSGDVLPGPRLSDWVGDWLGAESERLGAMMQELTTV